MMDEVLKAALDKRKEANALRKLSVSDGIDFSSNDYLGLARSSTLSSLITAEISSLNKPAHGSGGSRLLSGNTIYAETLESSIATFHGAQAGLIYNSGYDANIGLMSCIATRHDIILYDELVHASIIDGMGLSLAKSYKFKHNDIADLEQKLKPSEGKNIFIVVESVYSMDGDAAPLKNISALAQQYHANLIVDEAHATGVIGEHGKGLVNAEQLEQYCFARIHTFGKALGVHGAVVLGSNLLREYLINHSRAFIYTTALPLHSLVAIKCAYQLMALADAERQHLHSLINYFKQQIESIKQYQYINSNSAIQCIIIPGNDTIKAIAAQLQEAGFDIRPILSPTVAASSERLRICLHAFNTREQIDQMINVLNSIA